MIIELIPKTTKAPSPLMGHSWDTANQFDTIADN